MEIEEVEEIGFPTFPTYTVSPISLHTSTFGIYLSPFGSGCAVSLFKKRTERSQTLKTADFGDIV